MSRRALYLIDSDLIIRLLRGDEGAVAVFERLNPSQIAFSVTTYIEVGVGEFARDARFHNTMRQLFADVDIRPLSVQAAELAAREGARLRRENRQMGLGDLQIAATAVFEGRTLLTHNTEHFELFRGLRLESW
jgi:predicted nucleic acid-binding protein